MCNVDFIKDKTIIVIYVNTGAHPWDANQGSKMQENYQDY